MHFWTGIWKYYCHVSNQRPRICLSAKFGAKTKILKFRTKNALFGYFWAGIWKKTVVIFEILQKCLNLGPKMRDSGNFGLEFEKNYCHIWNQHPRICLIAKYHEIVRMPKFEIKSTKFGYFGARILKNDCHIWNQHLFLIP